MSELIQGSGRFPVVDPRRLIAQYTAGRHEELAGDFLEVFYECRRKTFRRLDSSDQEALETFVRLFLTLFTQSDFRPSQAALHAFVGLGAVISNVVSLSGFGTTDPFLRLLRVDSRDLPKFLTLCSARNTISVDRRRIFELDPENACHWYGVYAELYRTGLTDPRVWGNLKTHFGFAEARLDIQATPLLPYFAATYVGDDHDRLVRSLINRSFQEAARALTVKNTSDPRKIAVLSGGWTPSHSSYRITRAYVESLRGYHLTLIPLGNRPELDLSLFDEIRPLPIDRAGEVDVRPLLENDFMVAYYPEVGLSPQSMLLTNLRIAPIQIATLGHSVSTWGAQIDYFVSGRKVEPPDQPERNYSERLVLLPGYGAVHERPNYRPTGVRPDQNNLSVNCAWHSQKLNYPLAQVLKRIREAATRPFRFRFLIGKSLNLRNDYLPFVRDLGHCLDPDGFEILDNLSYSDYMAEMERGAFSLDSYPFGGCNTVIDSLFVRRAVVCREGDHWYNRIGPAMLRDVGLSELVVGNDSDLIEVAARMINDDAFRARMQSLIDGADLDATVFDRTEAASFRTAVDMLVEKHRQPQLDRSREPIRVGF